MIGDDTDSLQWFAAGEDLTGKEDHVCKMNSDGEMVLPTSDGEACHYLIEEVLQAGQHRRRPFTNAGPPTELFADATIVVLVRALNTSGNVFALFTSEAVAPGTAVMAASGGMIKAAGGAPYHVIGFTEAAVSASQVGLIRPYLFHVAA